jgi:hypothetical protein
MYLLEPGLDLFSSALPSGSPFSVDRREKSVAARGLLGGGILGGEEGVEIDMSRVSETYDTTSRMGTPPSDLVVRRGPGSMEMINHSSKTQQKENCWLQVKPKPQLRGCSLIFRALIGSFGRGSGLSGSTQV